MQFSLKDLFSAVTLIAVGAMCFPTAGRLSQGSDVIPLLIVTVGAAFTGAGLGVIFHKKAVGAIVGASIGVVLLLLQFTRVID